MGKPYCADIMMNSSAQHSSNKIFWSMAFSWLNDGIDRAHFTVNMSSLAADSNIMSWSFCAVADDGDKLTKLCNVKISSELLTSSSLPLTSLLCLMVGDENVPGKWNGLVCIGFGSFFDGSALNACSARGKMCSWISMDGSFGGESVEINDGGGGKAGGIPAVCEGGCGTRRFPFAAAKWSESNTFGWNALKCE